MKLIYRMLIPILLFSKLPLAYSRDIILIENMATIKEGELIKKILKNKFHIPEELITLRNISTQCEISSEAIIQLCMNEEGELIIKKMNQYIVKNSLGVFLNQTEEKSGETK
jgi:hypothetical protein